MKRFIHTGLALFAALYTIGMVHGCGQSLPTASELDDLNLKLAQCRAEARDDRDAGSAHAFMKYEDCKRRLGVQK